MISTKKLLYKAIQSLQTKVSSTVTGQDGSHVMGLSWDGKRGLLGVDGSAFPLARYDDLTSHLTVATVELDNISISANSTKDTITFSVAKSGYIPIAMVGYRFVNAGTGGSGVSYCTTYGAYIAQGNARFYVRNNSSSAVKIKAVAYVLYEKN